MPVAPALTEILAADPPRATGFIVTVYGDVVLPRGGALWMGSLIEACAAQGISESLVRTAVSRLVAAGQLEGERIGRRSFYRLTAAAAAEYARAGQLFYAPPSPPGGWRVALGNLPDSLPEPWVRLGPETALAPARAGLTLPEAVILKAESVAGTDGLPDFAVRHWPVAEAALAYRQVIALCDEMPVPQDGAAALALRLRLIHRFRHAALRDPRLPSAALPSDWPGQGARRRFARLYLDLAGPADAHIAEQFRDSDGPLPAATAETQARYDGLGQGLGD